MTCQHDRSRPDLPCPWPDCEEGTPQQGLVILKGDAGVVRGRPDAARLTIEAEEGVELWRRKRTTVGWEWERRQN